MTPHLKAFLQYLALNRNASAHTVRAYDSDLSQFLAHAASAAGVKVRDLAPAQLDRLALRGFLGERVEAGVIAALFVLNAVLGLSIASNNVRRSIVR